MDLTKLPSYENKERGYIGFEPYCDSMASDGNWSSTLEYENWETFLAEFKEADSDYNVIVNFYFDYEDEDDKNSPVHLNMWLLHPRKGASRGVLVNNIKDSELSEIKRYLKDQWSTLQDWFSWVNS